MAPDSDRAPFHQVLLPRSVARLPADLVGIIATVAMTGFAIFVPGVNQTPLRILVGLPFVLFVPGYAFIAALFPERDTASAGAEMTDADIQHRLSLERVRDRGSIDGIERVALSFGTSIAIVPLLGLLLNFTPWGIRLTPVFVAVSGFTLGATAIAAHRRWALTPAVRFRVPYDQWATTAKTELFEPTSRTDVILNVLLVVSLILAAASVTYAVTVPKQGESFTEFYVLTENETGDLVADNYPTEFRQGESQPLHLGIGNHEHQQMDYTVVVALQRVHTSNNSTQVQDSHELQRLQTTVGANETLRQQLNVTPPITGQRLRLAFFLYRGGPPAQPTVENAYRELHLWVNVTAPTSPETRRAPTGPSQAVSPTHRVRPAA